MPTPSTNEAEDQPVSPFTDEVYRVIVRPSIIELCKQVSEAIKAGWIPLGSPSTVEVMDERKTESIAWMQAVWFDHERKQAMDVAMAMAQRGVAALDSVTAQQEEGEEWRKPQLECPHCEKKAPRSKWGMEGPHNDFLACPACNWKTPVIYFQ